MEEEEEEEEEEEVLSGHVVSINVVQGMRD